MSSTEGAGWFSKRCVAATTNPGVQKPHWTPPASSIASCTALSSSPVAIPSTVVTSAPFTVTRHHQARTDELAIEDDRARSTFALFAGVLRAGEGQVVAQNVKQALPPGDVGGALLTVDGEADDHEKHLSRSRRASTPEAWRRYSAVERWSVIGLTPSDTSRPNSSMAASEGDDSPEIISSAAGTRIGVGATDARAI